MTDAAGLDGLIERVRARAADLDRRTSVRPTAFGELVGSLDLGGMLSFGRSLAADLGRVVAANREGRIDSRGTSRAEELGRMMSSPVARALPAPADVAIIEAVETTLGRRLPEALRRVYAEVADGGFGPGAGLLPLREAMREYADLRRGDVLPRGRPWPEGLLPVVRADPGFDCVELSTGRVVAWDPEDLRERSGEAAFARSFSEVAPSVEAWLEAWLGSRTQAEEHAAMMADLLSPASQVRQAREARAAIGRMSPAERAAMGLPEVGWEAVVWGGIGWPDDDAEGDPGG